MKLAIYEPDHRGHHFTYLRLLLGGIRELGIRPILVVQSGAERTAEFQNELAPLAGAYDLRPMPLGGNGSLGSAGTAGKLYGFVETLRQLQPEHLIVPDASAFVAAAGEARLKRQWAPPARCEIEVGLIRNVFETREASLGRRLRRRLAIPLYLATGFRNFFVLDDHAVAWVHRHGGPLAKRFRLLPDPVEPFVPITKQQARQQLGLPLDGRLVGMAGALDERKGVLEFLDAFGLASLLPTDRMLLAGPLGETVRQAIDAGRGAPRVPQQLVAIDRYLTAEEFMPALAAMDVVVTPYRNLLGPSGIVNRVAQVGRLLIGTDGGWMGDRIRDFRMGEALDPRNIPAFAQAIEKSINQAEHYVPHPAFGKWFEYLGADNFRAVWLARLRERVGAAPQPQIPWERVRQAFAS